MDEQTHQVLGDVFGDRREKWLVTGVAGFIGSNLLEALLSADQEVVGVDNFATGFQKNLDLVKAKVGPDAYEKFTFIKADINKIADYRKELEGCRYVLHQAAIGSVPRSIELPIDSNAANVDGFLAVANTVRQLGVDTFVFASSSSVYGDEPGLPKVEHKTGQVLSPYAATKLINEIYADVFQKCYDLNYVGLRYFNVFGPRQDPAGAYAAVIPKWARAAIEGQGIEINGDGETSRDFCFVDNAVLANILAATGPIESKNKIYNVACGERITLNRLAELIGQNLASKGYATLKDKITYKDFRPGDVRHSLADIGQAEALLNYQPIFNVDAGLERAMDWYCQTYGG